LFKFQDAKSFLSSLGNEAEVAEQRGTAVSFPRTTAMAVAVTVGKKKV